MTFAQLLLIAAGWAFKSSLLRADDSAGDRLARAGCLMTAIVCLYFGLQR